MGLSIKYSCGINAVNQRRKNHLKLPSDIEVMRYVAHLMGAVQWVLQQADLVTSASADLLAKANHIASLQAAKVIINAFDPSPFKTDSLTNIASDSSIEEATRLEIRRFLQMKTQSRWVVGTIGGTQYRKGFSALIDAFKQLLGQHPEALLLIVGKSPIAEEHNRALQYIESEGLQDHISLPGQVPYGHILAWVNEMDIFAHPSQWEGTPNAVLEGSLRSF